MAEKKKEGSEGVITMCVANGLFIIGKLIGGNKLSDPRVFDAYKVPAFDSDKRPIIGPDGKQQTAETIRMQPLPGIPLFCYIPADCLRYPVVESRQGPDGKQQENILALYKRVTTPPEEEKSILVPTPGLVLPPGARQN